MENAISEILDRSMGAIGKRGGPEPSFSRYGANGAALAGLLAQCNGLLAFYGALLVRPIADEDLLLGICRWNEPDVWKYSYPPLPDLLFFAEDAFGNQFAMSSNEIYSFDAETAELDVVSGTLEQWAKSILSDSEYQTGWPLCYEWQDANGPLSLGMRLVPRRPFVLGGLYEVENLTIAPDRVAMIARGGLARQLHHVRPNQPVDYELRLPDM